MEHLCAKKNFLRSEQEPPTWEIIKLNKTKQRKGKGERKRKGCGRKYRGTKRVSIGPSRVVLFQDLWSCSLAFNFLCLSRNGMGMAFYVYKMSHAFIICVIPWVKWRDPSVPVDTALYPWPRRPYPLNPQLAGSSLWHDNCLRVQSVRQNSCQSSYFCSMPCSDPRTPVVVCVTPVNVLSNLLEQTEVIRGQNFTNLYFLPVI